MWCGGPFQTASSSSWFVVVGRSLSRHSRRRRPPWQQQQPSPYHPQHQDASWSMRQCCSTTRDPPRSVVSSPLESRRWSMSSMASGWSQRTTTFHSGGVCVRRCSHTHNIHRRSFGTSRDQSGNHQKRNRSNNNNNNHRRSKGAFPDAYGLPFSISPDTALDAFTAWARQEQGLGGFLLRDANIQLSAAYCPVWSFDLNVRYVVTDPVTKQRRFHWKPDILRQAYGRQSIVHLPGLAVYAGHSYRRSLMDPLHSTSLIFLGDKVVPFDGSWMLRDMEQPKNRKNSSSSNDGDEPLTVRPDPWNAPRGRALAVLKESLVTLNGGSTGQNGDDDTPIDLQIQTEVLQARRVYMPTYVIDYTVLGMPYQAFVSGCDKGATVSGISHKLFEVTDQDINQAGGILASAAAAARQTVQVLGGRNAGTLIVAALQFFGSLVARFLMRIPLIGAVGGAFVGFRKIVRPWMDNRAASAEWERQREHEKAMKDTSDHVDDFEDGGMAVRYYQNNRARIIQHLNGDQTHQQGGYDWYAQWEKWARQQWEAQQQQQGGYSHQQQQQQQQTYERQQRTSGTRKKQEYKWDFNPSDPYSVLGIRRGASKSEVSAAFRKQMMLHHPDTKSNGSAAEKARAEERSKLITGAYQTIKSQM